MDTARVWQVGVEQLEANTDQPRKIFQQEALAELASSIREQGILQPITARPLGSGKFEVVAGERRWRAAQLAGLQEVPVLLKEVSEQKALELALIENIQRRDLSPIEEAEAYSRLMIDHSLTQQEVAQKVGKERATVANLLRLLNLVPELQEKLSTGELAMGQAKLLLSVLDKALQLKIGMKVVRGRLTVKATEKLIKESRRSPKSDVVDIEEISAQSLVKGLGEDLQKWLGTKVAIDYNKGRGKVAIHLSLIHISEPTRPY